MTKAFVFAATFVAMVSGTAYADVVPPEVYSCNNLSTGSPCDNGAGICQDSTCSRLDYSKWDRDASASPPTTSYSCRKCVPKGTGTGATTATGSGTGTGAITTTGTGTGTGAITTTGTGTGTGAITTTGTGTGTITTTGTGATTTTDASTGTGAITSTGTGATTTVASTETGATTTTATTTSPGKEEESKDSSGCSVGGARAIAPWLLAGIFAAVVTLLRRRLGR